MFCNKMFFYGQSHCVEVFYLFLHAICDLIITIHRCEVFFSTCLFVLFNRHLEINNLIALTTHKLNNIRATLEKCLLIMDLYVDFIVCLTHEICLTHRLTKVNI